MRLYTYLALVVVVGGGAYSVGYIASASKTAPGNALVEIRLVPRQEYIEKQEVPRVSRMVFTVQVVADSETQSLLQEQLDVMREQLAETEVILARLQLMSSACERPTSVKPTGGKSHEPIHGGQ